ncbi:unnamed protein product [Closterium sp. NIES-65]|nr:unnamed protein product [Closterium sp. NIES-65]
MYLTLYCLVTRLPDSLRAVRDHFLALCPTELTVDLLEKHRLAAEASIVAEGASRGDPRTPFFEGCSPSPIPPSDASAAAVDNLGAEEVGAASASSGRRKAAGAREARVVEVTAREAVVEAVGAVGAVAGVVAATVVEVAGVEEVVVAAVGVVAAAEVVVGVDRRSVEC